MRWRSNSAAIAASKLGADAPNHVDAHWSAGCEDPVGTHAQVPLVLSVSGRSEKQANDRVNVPDPPENDALAVTPAGCEIHAAWGDGSAQVCHAGGPRYHRGQSNRAEHHRQSAQRCVTTRLVVRVAEPACQASATGSVVRAAGSRLPARLNRTMLNSIRAIGGMAVAPHALAAQSALAVLREHGNALEAMIAAAATIPVVYPHMNSIGGDGFWLIHVPGQPARAIDACGAAAARASRDWYAGRASASRFRSAVGWPPTRSPHHLRAGPRVRVQP